MVIVNRFVLVISNSNSSDKVLVGNEDAMCNDSRQNFVSICTCPGIRSNTIHGSGGIIIGSALYSFVSNLKLHLHSERSKEKQMHEQAFK